MYLKEKLQLSAKLHSGMTYSAVGHESNVNHSTLYITYSVLKQKYTLKKVMF